MAKSLKNNDTKPAKKKPAKTAPAKAATSAKPKKKPATSKAPAGKKKSTKPKSAPKPTRAAAAVAVSLIESSETTLFFSTDAGGGGGAPAAPVIIAPQAGALVPVNTDLPVSAGTNRGDLRYIVELIDFNVGPQPVASINVPAPGQNPINATFVGANFIATHQYRIRVFVDPVDGPTPPNTDFAVFVSS